MLQASLSAFDPNLTPQPRFDPNWLHLCRKGIAAAAGFIRKIACAQIFSAFRI
jgi:hypothetical protein